MDVGLVSHAPCAGECAGTVAAVAFVVVVAAAVAAAAAVAVAAAAAVAVAAVAVVATFVTEKVVGSFAARM